MLIVLLLIIGLVFFNISNYSGGDAMYGVVRLLGFEFRFRWAALVCVVVGAARLLVDKRADQQGRLL